MMTMILRYLVYFFGATIGSFIYLNGYYESRNQKFKYSKNSIVIILFVANVITINNIFNVLSFKLIINYISTTMLIFFATKSNMKKSLGFSTYIYTLSTIVELIIVLALSQFMNQKEFLNGVFPNLSINIIYTIFMYLSFKLKFLKSLIIKTETFFNSSIKTDYIVLLGIVVLNILCLYYKSNINGISITMFLISVISLMIVLFFFVLKEKHKKERQILKSEFLSQAIDTYEIAISDYKTLKHNLMNDFLAIKTVASTECQELINEKIKKYSKDYEWIDLVSEIPSGIQGLLFLKAQQAKQKGIELNIKSNNISIKDLKLSTKMYAFINDSLGILLDNAIDASLESKNKNIMINILQYKKEITLEIINKFSHNINVDMLGSINYSTKSEKSGIGLNYIIKNSGSKIKIFNKIVNDYFVSTLKLNI